MLDKASGAARCVIFGQAAVNRAMQLDCFCFLVSLFGAFFVCFCGRVVRIKSSCAANFAAARLAQALEIISPFFFSLSSGRLLKTFKRRKTKDEMDEDAHIFYFS
jgi:hypothetical protein